MDYRSYSGTETARSLTSKLLRVVLSTMLIGVLSYPASAQDACDEIGPDCRTLTASEVKAFKELVLTAKGLLPVPDTARYALESGIDETYTMPFVALTKIPGAAMTGRSWQAGCFPTDPNNTLHFLYDAKAVQEKSSGKANDPLAAVQALNAMMENKVEIVVWLRPHPYLVNVENGKTVDVRDQDAYDVVKKPEFLSWQTGDDNVTLNMILGPRTAREEETLNTDMPSPKFAPLKSIELIISGPKKEVAALRKRIEPQALAALLGPVVK